MYAIEFESDIRDRIIRIPDEYKNVHNNIHVKRLLIIDETKQKTGTKRKMNAVSIDTKGYQFNRDEANKR